MYFSKKLKQNTLNVAVCGAMSGAKFSLGIISGAKLSLGTM